jgi:Tfp pilus assembly protein PilP
MTMVYSSILPLILSFTLYGQFTYAQDTNQVADGAKPAVKEDAAEVAVSKIKSFLAPFVYDRDLFRDPFEAQGMSTPLQPGQVYGPFLQLQTFRLADFKLKGLMWKTDKPVAIFESPDGAKHRLSVKDYIGENFGYIATIREKEVVVIQTIEENQKRYSTTKVVFLNE